MNGSAKLCLVFPFVTGSYSFFFCLSYRVDFLLESERSYNQAQAYTHRVYAETLLFTLLAAAM